MSTTSSIVPHREPAQQVPAVRRAAYGCMPGGTPVHAWTLTNRRGTQVTAISLGATITSLRAADRDGALGDIVLGMDDLEGYLEQSIYLGAVAGRYANRIANARFTLDGREYHLAPNIGPHHLHGGIRGFDRWVWSACSASQRHGPAVRFCLTSPDGDQGYPGTLRVSVRYRLTHDDRLVVDYTARTSRATVLNLTQHSYFNLSAGRSDDILQHVLQINADRFTPMHDGLLPTGELVPVAGTPFDFRQSMAIGARIGEQHPQLTWGNGYDHNFVLRRATDLLAHAATLRDPLSGRTLEVWTTEPGMQFYAGTWLDGRISGRGGRRFGRNAGLCLETQHFPDSPNQSAFPSTVLRPGEVYQSRTVFALGVEA